jgi:glycosyltransferase involved in cell wall biosynthesis
VAGVPTVATPIGVIGLEPEAGHQYQPAEKAHEFAGAIAELCERPELRERIAGNARRLIAERYSRPVIARMMAEAIASIGAVPA